MASGFTAADYDGDGDVDLYFTQLLDGNVLVVNNGGFQFTDISAAAGIQDINGASDSASAADFDGDGANDVLAGFESPSTQVAWYENTDEKGAFGSQQAVATSAATPTFSVFAADLDCDGDQDVLTASPSGGRIAWYENTDALGTFLSRIHI